MDNGNIFISYSREDQKVVDQVADALRQYGFNLFLDGDSLDGSHWAPTVFDTLSGARAVVILLSANTRTGGWVKSEVVAALESGVSRPVIPVLLDADAKKNWIWPLVASRQTIDMNGDRESIRKAVGAIGAIIAPRLPPLICKPSVTYPIGGHQAIGILLAAIIFMALVMWFSIPLKSGRLLDWLPQMIPAFLAGLAIGKWINAKGK